MSSSTRRLQNIARIQCLLDALYPHPPVPLNSVNTFTFLVAVVLSAQTTDGKVNDVTAELFRRASTPEAMSRLRVEEVESMIKSVGLAPKKAVYVVELSKKLVADFNSVVPSTYAELESLPGVGHKTASVLMSQSFGQPALAVDTHVHRLANRWGLSVHKNVDMVQRDLMEAFPQEHWNKLHLQMIYFGREFCTAKDHTPSGCPICCFTASSKALPPLSSISEHSIRSQFASANRVKGIVYYIDRIEQLKTQQHLILGTPSPVAPPPQKIHQDLSAIAISLAATHSFDDGEGEVASKHPVKVKVKRGRTAMGLDHRDVIADVKPTTRKSDKRLKTTDVDMATVAVTAREASRLQPRRSTSAASRKNK